MRQADFKLLKRRKESNVASDRPRRDHLLHMEYICTLGCARTHASLEHLRSKPQAVMGHKSAVSATRTAPAVHTLVRVSRTGFRNPSIV